MPPVDRFVAFWLPKPSSTIAPKLDHTLKLALLCGAGLLAALLVAMAVTLVRRDGRRAVSGGAGTTAGLALGLAGIAAVVFMSGYGVSQEAAIAPTGAYLVQVVAEKGTCTFTHPGGISSANLLVVPMGKPIRLDMSAKDLVTRLSVPELRLNQEMAPGRYTSTWFEAISKGDLAMRCAAPGVTTPAVVRVVSPADFDDWLEVGGNLAIVPSEHGRLLYTKLGCQTCHLLSNAPGNGPSLVGLFGRSETLSDGTTVVADEAYLRESVLLPAAKVVKNYPAIMPPLAKKPTERQLSALVAYLRSLSSPTP